MTVTAICAETARAQTAKEFDFNIAAQPLADALVKFGLQSGYQVTVDGAAIRDIDSNGVSGEISADEALDRLLAGTGFTYRVDGNVVTISQAGAEGAGPDSIELGPIKVEGRAESAYGPVQGYKASRSATATKTDLPIVDTPASIQVVPREVIDDQNANRLSDALRNVSGVQTSTTTGNRSDGLLVRGFTASRIARDGFLSASSFGEVGFVDLANVERVEVLKGPASVLYGSGDPGGLINVVTKKPQSEPFYGLSGTYGRFDFYRGEIDINQPLGTDGQILARLNASYQDAGSFRDLFVDDERFHIAPSLRWVASERTTVDLQFEYFEQDGQFDRGLILVDGDPLALPRDRYLGRPSERTDADEWRLQAEATHRFRNDWAARVRARATDSNAKPTQTFIPGARLQPDGRTANRTFFALNQDFQTYAVDANLSGEVRTGPLQHQLLFGTDTQITRFESTGSLGPASPIDIFDPVYDNALGPLTPLSDQERNIDIYGVYAQDLISFGAYWKVLLGGRYDIAETEFLLDGDTDTDKVDQEFSPRVGVVFQPTETLSLYASYSESFLPTLDGQTADGTDFEPERGNQVEVGVKKLWFNERLSTTFSVFQLTRENVSTGDPANPGFSIQVGEQRSRGAELDIAGELYPGWKVIGSLTYLDSEIVEDNTFDPGNQLVNVPEWSGSVWTTYAFQGGALRGLELGGGVFAVGKRKGNLSNSFDVPSYARVDLVGRYKLTENVSLSVNVENLFNTTYVEAVSSVSLIEPGAPLSAFVTLDLRF